MSVLRHAFLAAAALSACGPSAQTQTAPTQHGVQVAPFDVPAGLYTLDDAHSTVTFGGDHVGFSTYVGRFSDVDAELRLDPANPEAAQLTAVINTSALSLPAPPPGFLELLQGTDWFDTAAHPTMSYRSTRIERTGADTARIHGDLTLRGVTRPVVLDARLGPGHQLEPRSRLGFSATGALRRSEFGLEAALPPRGTTMGVGDVVSIEIESQWIGPPRSEAEDGAAAQ